MVYIALPDSQPRLLPFYLATEEYVARRLDMDECFFSWQVKPTVIFGRNQLIENEVNIDFCKRNNIQTYRRKSGGGCVYADMGNVMFSYITKDENVNLTFNKYINMVALALYRLGVDAKASGRNDILIDGRKVSGNAFYHIPGHSIVHGTMLYDTNMEYMVGSITPNDEKLLSKGVKSVRKHIALLKDYIDLSLDDFILYMRRNLCDSEFMLTSSDIKEIEEIEKEYHTDEFIYGKNPRYTIQNHQRLENVGDFEIRIELKNEIIKQVNIMGDYFLTGDIDNRILTPLRNVHYDYESINDALPTKVDDIIMNLKKEDLVNLILKH
jgi:lipoate-protein ligase A